MKKLVLAALLSLFVTATHAQFVSFNIGAETIKDASGTAISMSGPGLLLLVASTTDSTFNGPSDTAFVSGDDVVISSWDLSSTTVGAGSSQKSIANFALGTGGVATGNPLQLYWFPTLTTANTAPGPNVAYGQYRDPVANGASGSGTDSSDPWFVPSATITRTLSFYNSSAQFLHISGNAANDGTANLTTVPEPSSYAAIFGGLCLAGALARRNFRKRLA